MTTTAIALAAAAAAGALVWALTAPPPPPDSTGSGLTIASTVPTPSGSTTTPGPSSSAPTPDASSSTTPSPQRFATVPATRGASQAPRAAVATPRRIGIADLRLDLPVEPVGVDGNGAMALPEDPEVVGWYRFGAAPGARAGSSVLAAHVDSRRYGVGPFADLASLKPGARIVVSTAEGEVAYAVERVDLIPRLRLDSDALFARGGDHRLRVVTCGGPYDRDAGGYLDNVVVTAVPV